MTNLQSGVSSRFSRERILFWSPVVLGVLLSAAAGGFLVWPAAQQLQRNQQQLNQLREQEARLPLLRQQLSKQLDNLEQAKQKQRQILQLIAGSGDISTFMAQLGQEARRSGVQMDSYEPLTVVAYTPPASPPPPAEGAKPDANAPPPPPPDPLMAPGLQKTTLLITARGSGLQLQDFLRRLERLSLLVVQSDLALRFEPSSTPAGVTTLKLNLSLYSKAP
jgi:type IV pilus assembly protein PilO